jgi:hypothetical protein
MKYLLITVFFLPVVVFAQNCALKKEKDQFTQQERLTTGFMTMNNSKMSITADDKELDFFISLGSSACFDDASTLSIVFEDGRTKSNFRSSGSMNCEGLFHFVIRNTTTTNSNLQRLATKKVKTMTLTHGKDVTSITPNESEQQLLVTATSCMATEAKTLIKKP